MPRGYALARGEGLDGDTSLKASGSSSGGTMTLIESHTDGGARFLDEFHAAADWPARDEVAERYSLTFAR